MFARNPASLLNEKGELSRDVQADELTVDDVRVKLELMEFRCWNIPGSFTLVESSLEEKYGLTKALGWGSPGVMVDDKREVQVSGVSGMTSSSPSCQDA